MQKSISQFIVILFVGSLVALSGCEEKKGEVGPVGATGAKGDVGPTGATGAKGDTGATGATGLNGAQGVAGQNGNANVKLFVFNNLFSLSPSGQFKNFDLAGIRTGQLDSCVFLAYYALAATGTSTIWPSPSTDNVNNFSSIVSYLKGLNNVVAQFKISNPDGTDFSGSGKLFNQFRVIVAPVSSITGGRKAVDFSNYESTARYFGLK